MPGAAECAFPAGRGHYTLLRHSRPRKETNMANVVVVGAQWGDEGKGKIVDWLSERADVIARFQGGHNAGTRWSSAIRSISCRCCPRDRAQGQDGGHRQWRRAGPWALFAEIDKLAAQGVAISPENLMIAENTR